MSLLGVLGIDRGSTIISNALFCHTKGNRTPLRDEVEVCRVWKLLETECYQKVRYIFLFGNDACQSFFGFETESIMRRFGIVYQAVLRGRKCLVFPFYHPAHVLRQKRLYEGMFQFAHFARQLIEVDRAGQLDWRV